MEIILRTIFIFSLLIISFFQELELKPLAILFSIFYISFYLLINKFVNKLTILPLDLLTLIYFIYLTGNPYLSIIFFILSPAYINKKYEIYSFISAHLIILISSIYLSGYIDYTLIVITAGLYISLLGIAYNIKIKEEKIRKLENNLISLTSKFVKQFNEAKKYDLSKFNNISLENQKKSLFELFSKLNVSGISLFDIENNKCVSVGEASCRKDFLKFIEPQIYSFKYNDHWIVVVPVYKKDKISKVFFFFYKEEKLIDNLNIFYYLKVKLENELLSSLKPISNFVERINKEILKENNNQNYN